MSNLLKETIRKLRSNGKKPKDVEWVGCEEFYTDWDNFEKVANTEYDGGYGAAEVAQDLMIVGKDFYMTRGEYDGSEWWDFHTIPPKPAIKKEINFVTVGQHNKHFNKTERGIGYIFEDNYDRSKIAMVGWESLSSINKFGKNEESNNE